jgi:RNA polymerase I specific transcription initiation factor
MDLDDSPATSIFGGPTIKRERQVHDSIDENLHPPAQGFIESGISDVSQSGNKQDEKDGLAEIDLDDDFDDAPQYLSKGSRSGEKWSQWTLKDRTLYQRYKQLEDADLSRQLLNAHGFSARQYDKLPEKDRRYQLRRTWTADWTPRRSWTAWPLNPHTVPRRGDRLWASSMYSEPKWTPSRDLEEELFSLLLKRARTQWDSDAVPDKEQAKPYGSHRELGAEKNIQSGSAAAVSIQPQAEERGGKKRKIDDTSGGIRHGPVVSTDEDHSRRILQPIIRSTISKFDQVLHTLDRSAIGTHPSHKSAVTYTRKGNKNTRSQRSKMDKQDWSQILGIASIAGISPEVISRSATRCAAMFNEHMDFKMLPEKVSSLSSTPHRIIEPKDILQHEDPSRRLTVEEEGDREGNLTQGCPFRECSYYGRTMDEWGRKKIEDHMKEVHQWKNSQPPEDFQELTGYHGAVRADGYLTPLKWKYMSLRGILPEKYRSDSTEDEEDEEEEEERSSSESSSSSRLGSEADPVEISANVRRDQPPASEATENMSVDKDGEEHD